MVFHLLQACLSKSNGEPDRIRKQADSVHRAAASLDAEVSCVIFAVGICSWLSVCVAYRAVGQMLNQTSSQSRVSPEPGD